MNRHEAMNLAERITNQQLLQMFKSAKDSVKDWTKPSNINKGLTRGATWNILAKDFDVAKDYKTIIKYNMIREFGRYLPPELTIARNKKSIPINPSHQEPNFDNY